MQEPPASQEHFHSPSPVHYETKEPDYYHSPSPIPTMQPVLKYHLIHQSFPQGEKKGEKHEYYPPPAYVPGKKCLKRFNFSRQFILGPPYQDSQPTSYKPPNHPKKSKNLFDGILARIFG